MSDASVWAGLRDENCSVMVFPSPPLLANWQCIYSSELAPGFSFSSLPIKKIGCERLTLSVHLWVKLFEKRKKIHNWAGLVVPWLSGRMPLKWQSLIFAHMQAFPKWDFWVREGQNIVWCSLFQQSQFSL